MSLAYPVITSIRARGVNVPMTRPLRTSGGSVTTAPLVLVDLEASGGLSGCSYVFCYTPMAIEPVIMMVERLGELILREPLAPLALDEKLRGSLRLLGSQGIAGMALAGIDMAAWDALAKSAGMSLSRYLGGAPVPILAYNSNGLGLIGSEEAGQEAETLAEGFSGIKLRLGYPTLGEDEDVLDAVEEAVGNQVVVMSDYNQCLSVSEAKIRVASLEDWDLAWIEEPTRWDDYEGNADIRAASGVPIQLGENCWGPHDMAKALAAGSSDLFMPDAMKIGGVTGWMRAVALAEPLGLPISSHLFPEISAHLLSVTPTRHWLEYVDWANPILKTPLRIEDGKAMASEAPGIGLEWDEDALKAYQVGHRMN